MSATDPSARPLLKWVGGKTQLVPTLLDIFPAKIGRYIEPFFGGGAVFWALRAAGRFTTAHLSDANPVLVDTYTAVRDEVEALIVELGGGQYANALEGFMALRAADTTKMSLVQRAARMVFLNKTAFNGLYRVNRKGGFNVPFAHYPNPTILDVANLRACSRALAGASFALRDFAEAAAQAEPGDLVYLDPPYVPASLTSNFTSYAPGGFGAKDHERCAKTFRALAERGVSVVLSNSDTPLVRELYAGFEMREVQVRRNVGAGPATRKSVGEVIVIGGARHAILAPLPVVLPKAQRPPAAQLSLF